MRTPLLVSGLCWMLAPPAWAEPCADPAAQLQSAERDAVSFFLNDAQLQVAATLDALGCSAPADPALLARLWQTQALIWMFQEADAKAARGWYAARRTHPETWNPDFGDEARAAYEASTPDAGIDAPLRLRGVGEDDWVSLDGVASRPERIAPGLHILQVGTGDTARYAVVLDVGAGGEEVVVAVPGVVTPDLIGATIAAPSPVPTPEPTPLLPPEPTPLPPAEPAPLPAPEPLPEPEPNPEPTASELPEVAQDFTAPLQRLGGKDYLDGAGQQMRWREHVLPLAGHDRDGERARARFSSNAAAQLTALTLVGAGAYSTYVWTWDTTTGHNLGASPALMGSSIAVTLSAFIWEITLIRKRPQRRTEVERAAERVLESGAR